MFHAFAAAGGQLLVGGGGTPTPATADYYFDSVNGNDSNDGSTTALAKKTIEEFNSLSFSAGDVIRFKAGQTHRTPFAGMTIPSSGTAANPITIGSYGAGAKPKIFGSTDGTGLTWTQSGNIWKTPAITGYSQDFVRRANQIFTDASPAEGFENSGGLYPTGADCGSAVWGWDWTADGGSRWYCTVDDEDPGPGTITHVILDGTLQGAAESSISNVNASGEWFFDDANDRLYLGGSTNPETAYESVVAARLNTNGDWCIAHNGANHWYFMYDDRGTPASQYSYLELPNSKYVIDFNGKNYVYLENLECRHAGEGVEMDGDYGKGTDVDIRQVCRNGLEIRGNYNTWTGTWTIENVGSSWWKKPNPAEEDTRNGHGYHLADGDYNEVSGGTIVDISGEDCYQTAKTNNVGNNNWVRNTFMARSREDAIDIKDGKCNLDNVTAYAVGDGAGRNCILLHNNATGLYAKDSYLQVDEGVSGNGDVVTRQIGVDIELERTTIDARTGGAYGLDCKQGSGDVTTTACVWVAPPNRSAMRLINGHWTSTNDSAYQHGTGNDAMFELRGGSGGTNVIKNGAFQARQRIFDIDNNGGFDMDYTILHRTDSSNDWINDNGSTLHESDIDGGYTSGNFSIDSNVATEDPDFDSPTTGDLTISAGAGAASGANASDQPSTDREGNAYTANERGAYSLGS